MATTISSDFNTRTRAAATADQNATSDTTATTSASRPSLVGLTVDTLEVGGSTSSNGLSTSSAASTAVGPTRPTTATTDTSSVGELAETGGDELGGVSAALTASSGGTLPAGVLTANADGSITTPGGYTIINDGNSQWRVQSPDGSESKIWGDPHVDQDGDGTADWHFNKDSSFILPDGTKIFCDTTKVGTDAKGGDIAMSTELKIQYGDSLGTMNVQAGGAGTVTDGGKAYDAANADGDSFVMGNDDKWYDAATLGRLYDAGGDFAVDIDTSVKGEISDEATIELANSGIAAGGGLKDTGASDSSAKADTAAEAAGLNNDQSVDGEDTGTPVKGKKKLADAGFARLIADPTGDAAGQSLDTATGTGDVKGTGLSSKVITTVRDGVLGNGSALASYDKNGDGSLSDAEMVGLKIWVDANGDNTAQADELENLSNYDLSPVVLKQASAS